ncbi:xanthine dehydrogenase family protein molybdopterin-binding subunit [Pseudooceanicola sp. HF7]|uniref:xanthine dehydrogenase family protein molybdopterin-binding subunit n=1 Tax=Pseudooceanicola sp. HF7 TaxID=2721560 RepID=UPI00142F4A13|nr:xanthine dehydrogenase family protein molybdopterin-binding subunit [Pseudooceanicola sp. HF7]NIZ08046.1 xanthine dehydrogenase family protein molybdopterin-binding subunit [Pseudooceanicola sp. HF7]
MTRKGRIEDLRLLTGKGRFTDDCAGDGRAGQPLWVTFLRAPHAAGQLLGIATQEAAAMPGVRAIFTGADLAADGIGPCQPAMALEGPDGQEWQATERPLLVQEPIRHLGEPLAMVVAETRAQAMDAAEALEADIAERPTVISIPEARAPEAPLVHDSRPGNLGYQWSRGDWAATGAALEASAHLVRVDLPVSRVTAMALEPRAALAWPDGEGMGLELSIQSPTGLRDALAGAFDMEAGHIRVLAGDVGGSFGMKAGMLREEMLVFWAARKLGVPLRWRADRSEGFLSDEAGRDILATAELGLDAEGNFTALRVHEDVNLGAYASGRSITPILNIGGIAGVYRTPLIAGRIDGWLTHTVPVAAYRGAGRPEATYIMERLVDAAAAQLGVDRIALRRRNLIPRAAMPWASPFVFDYDCGDFEQILDAAVARADVAGFAARREASAQRGQLRGLGLAFCIEAAGGTMLGPGRDWTDLELLADGRLRIAAGAFSTGTGLETAFSDLVAQELAVPRDRVGYLQGDTDVMERGAGMGGSGAMVKGASALRGAVSELLELARARAAEMLELPEAEITYEAGLFRGAGRNRVLSFADIAAHAAEAGVRLRARGSFTSQGPTFPNGCHVCEVEVDRETGLARPVAYCAVEDIGTVLNPQLAEGQLHGGVAQALGQVFMEELRYGAGDGQLLTGSLMDYALPRATDLPGFSTAFLGVPTALNPLGVKGVGEAGSVGALAAGMLAVRDALAFVGVEAPEMPASPARVWAALQGAAARG